MNPVQSTRSTLWWLFVVLGLAFPTDLLAQRRPEKDLPDPARGYDWEEAARKEGLSDKEIEQLARDKVLVANTAFKQVFTPYIGARLPLFITSDSLLNGFHVLYEESIVRLEQANARKLGGILELIDANLETADQNVGGDPRQVRAAKLRAKVVIATAMRLMGEKPAGRDGNTTVLVNEEVARIEAAKGQLKPKWLGPPDDGFLALDYSRYKPRGFYTRTLALQRYFRAVSWLQSIPFRISKDEELLAILMLGDCVKHQRTYQSAIGERDIRQFCETFDTLVGPGDDWDIMTAAAMHNTRIMPDGDAKKKKDWLAEVRAALVKQAKESQSPPPFSDMLAFPPNDRGLATELCFRVFSARRTPDAMLLQRTTDSRKFQRAFPDGLEICAALGSNYARSRLSDQEDGKLLAEIDRCQGLFSDNSLSCDYFRCLEALLKPEPDAPALMSSRPWQIKSCQTVLGGWAQMRHAWALQAKQSAHSMCATRLPPGLVEPQPEFFGRMARLSERTRPILKQCGAFDFDAASVAADLRAGLPIYKKEKAARENDSKTSLSFTTEEWNLMAKVQMVVFALEKDINDEYPSEAEETAAEAAAVLKLAEQLEHGQTPTNQEFRETLQNMATHLDLHWATLAGLCHRLESLAHKQLRGVAFSEEENQFLRDYGKSLAGVMLYDGNSYLTPTDDAPRVVDVHSNPNLGKHLEVGIARARALYVLYPVKGGEILCRGAVMPYFEFAHDARLTDAEWKTMLDCDKRPRTPDWIRPIVAPGDVLK
jgi:hypothetical protein